jgi:hypothetical protein
LFNAALPFVKTPGEALLGRSTYPNPLEPRPIRDPLEFMARSLSVDIPYRAIRGRPSRGLLNESRAALVYQNDPGQMAYMRIKSLASDHNEKAGRGGGDMNTSPRANALYYYKKAVQLGDQPAAQRYHAEYLRLGGKQEGIGNSIERAAPLAAVPVSERQAFVQNLSRRDRQTLQQAEDWYRKIYQPTGVPIGEAVTSRRQNRSGYAPSRR